MVKIKFALQYANKLAHIICIGITSLLTSCEMIEYHPYDLNINGETNINAKNIQLIEQKMKGKEKVSFVVISDTQRWYDETEDAVDYINKMDSIDFVIHTGDISDFGLKMEFEKQLDIMNKLKVPYVVVLGNHDCLGTGVELFNKIFGQNNYAFTAGNVRFICMNTNALEFDYSSNIPDLSFLEQEYKNLSPEIKKTVVAMHAGPFSDQFNNNIAKVFQYYIKQFPDLQFCIYGHGHTVRVDDYFNDGIIYYECTCAKHRGILRFTIKKEGGYLYEAINY